MLVFRKNSKKLKSYKLIFKKVNGNLRSYTDDFLFGFPIRSVTATESDEFRIGDRKFTGEEEEEESGDESNRKLNNSMLDFEK